MDKKPILYVFQVVQTHPSCMCAPYFLHLFFLAFALAGCGQNNPSLPASKFKITRSELAWQQLLTAEQYRVLRKKGTELAFSGEYWNHHDTGMYYCAACRQALFTSTTKFESGSGWPSFYQPVSDSSVMVVTDTSFGMLRDEVVCSQCGGHLGHVFNDGPEPTGLRFCMNSISLKFEKKPE